MGPCFISTEGFPCGRLLGWRDAASMGPCFISTEGTACLSVVAGFPSGFNGAVLHQHGRPVPNRRLHVTGGVASMGPCFISTEGNAGRFAITTRSHASMGPCFISTEGVRAWFCRHRRTASFNGAVLHQHGRLDHAPVDLAGIGLASMGPCFISTEGENRSTLQNRSTLASMGPCFISTEGL